MKEMIYEPNRKKEVLLEGKYMEYQFYILSLGTHPAAYIEIPFKSKLYGLNYDKTFDLVDIVVHGGLTFSNSTLNLENMDVKGWFIGWDYGHYGDYLGYDMNFPLELQAEEKRWTTKEIFEDVKSAIKQIRKFDLGE